MHTQSHSQTKDHGYWSGNETSAHVKSRIDHVPPVRPVSMAGMVSSRGCGKGSWKPHRSLPTWFQLHNIPALLKLGWLVFVLCWYSFLCWSVVVIVKSGNYMASQRAWNLLWRVVGWHIMCLEPLINYQQVVGLWLGHSMPVSHPVTETMLFLLPYFTNFGNLDYL